MEQPIADAAADGADLARDTIDPVDLQVARERELRFLAAHPDLEQRFPGEWIAVDGEAVVANGDDLAGVLQRAEDAGHPDPFILSVPDPSLSYVF